MTLIAHWPLSGNLTDSSGNSYDGTGVASPTFVDWRDRQAVSLNGSTQRVDLSTHATSLDGLTQGVISGWFKTSAPAHATNNDQCVWSLADTNGNSLVRVQVGQASGTVSNEALSLIVTDAGTVRLRMHAIAGEDRHLNDGRWHWFAIIVDGVDNRIIIDGFEATVTFPFGSVSTSALTNVANADNSYIGAASWNNIGIRDEFGGQIADLRIYDSAMTTTEAIETLFNPYTDIYWDNAVQNGPWTDATVTTEVSLAGPGDAVPTENDFTTYQYRHHVRLWWKDGVSYLASSVAPTSEKGTAFAAIGFRSTDKGNTWTGPDVLLAPQDDYATGAVTPPTLAYQIYPSTFVEYDDRVFLVSAFEEVDYATNPADRTLLAMIAQEWDADGIVGSPFRITPESYTPVSGYSEITHDATLGPILLALGKLTMHWGGDTDGSSISGIEGVLNNSDYFVVEPFVVRDASGNLVRGWRDATAGVTTNQIWTQWSDDDGLTWDDLMPTRITNWPSASAAIRNSENRLVLVGNPPNVTARTPLYLASSEVDGDNLTTVLEVIDGNGLLTYNAADSGKGPGWQYPDICQVGNYYYIGYSEGKERLRFTRMLVPGLTDNDNDESGADFIAHLFQRSRSYNPVLRQCPTCLGMGVI